MSWTVPTCFYCCAAQRFPQLKKTLNLRPLSSFTDKLLLASARSLYSVLKPNSNNYHLSCSLSNSIGFFFTSLIPNSLLTRTLCVSGGYEMAPVSWMLIHRGAWQEELWTAAFAPALMLVKQSSELFFCTTEWSLCWPECRLSWSTTRERDGSWKCN